MQVLHLKLDEPLRQIFGEERLALRRVSERLSEMATQEEPIEMMYSLRLQGEPTPMVFEALVQVEDPVMHHMRELVQVREDEQPAHAHLCVLCPRFTCIPGSFVLLCEYVHLADGMQGSAEYIAGAVFVGRR